MAERKVNQTKPVPAGNPNNTPTKGPIVTHLLGIPDTFAVSNPIVHMNSDEYRIRFKRLPARVCTHCGSTNCVIKDGGRDQTIRHTPVGRRGTLLTIHRRRFLCRDCGKTCYEKIDLIHDPLHITDALYLDITLVLSEPRNSRTTNAWSFQ